MKKYLPYILIGVVVIGVFGSVGVHRVHALGFLDLLSTPGQAVKTLVAWVVYLILTLISQLLTIAGFFFEKAVEYSINLNKSGTLEMVKAGWAQARNVANLFFIFILLYIAIATILQLAGYGMKELLVKVVIIALLVNFSFMITGVIIDASNILATEFYNMLTNIKDTSGNSVSLSAAIVNGIKPQTLYFNDSSNVFTNSQDQTLTQIIIICVFGIIILLIMSFIILAAGFLFVIRTAVLWLLMILSPLAFLAMALPKTQEYSKKWWTQLFNQSFFAPVYLFLLYLTIKIISEGNLLKDLNATNEKFGSAFGSPDYANVQLILNFAIIIVLMVASLIIAKQMGAGGAKMVMDWGQSAKKWGQGYAGKVSGRMARRAAAPVAEKIATSEKGWAKTLRAIPGVARGAATIAEKDRARIGELQKGYEKYSDLELKNMTPKLMPFNRAAVVQELAKRGKLKDKGPLALSDKEIMKSREIMEKYGMSTKDVDKQRPDLVPDEPHPTVPGKTKKEVAIGSIFPSDIEKVGEKLFTDASLRETAMKSFGSGYVQKIMDRGGNVEKEFFTHIANLGNTIEEITKKLEAPVEKGGYNNRSLAGWVRGGLGAKQILVSYGMPEPKEKEEGESIIKPAGKYTKI